MLSRLTACVRQPYGPRKSVQQNPQPQESPMTAATSSKSPALFLFIAAVMLLCTGAEGGCGGTLQPEIERPNEEVACPEATPEPWSSCSLSAEETCRYQEFICCDQEGNQGSSHYAAFAHCIDGQWAIAMAGIRCQHGFWPSSCTQPLTIE